MAPRCLASTTGMRRKSYRRNHHDRRMNSSTWCGCSHVRQPGAKMQGRKVRQSGLRQSPNCNVNRRPGCMYRNTKRSHSLNNSYRSRMWFIDTLLVEPQMMAKVGSGSRRAASISRRSTLPNTSWKSSCQDSLCHFRLDTALAKYSRT